MTVYARFHWQRGFTLLELMLVLVMLGGMAMVAMQYRAYTLNQDDAIAQGYHDQIAAALYRYAARHYRLPCADTNGDGFEGNGGDCGLASSNVVGGVPFLTLGMNEAQGFNKADRERFVYGVFRDFDADLARLEERTGDESGSAGYLSLDDLRYALHSLGQRDFDNEHIYVTGDDQQAGKADCESNFVANLAFFVAYAGTSDADGYRGPFDGENSHLRPPFSGRCVSGPLTKQGEQYDDAVIAVGFAELLGYLSQ